MSRKIAIVLAAATILGAASISTDALTRGGGGGGHGAAEVAMAGDLAVEV
jgi:hypothetical protein